MLSVFAQMPDASDSFYMSVPDGTDSVYMSVPEVGIDPQKVLILVNSDVALSDLIADYYIAARGLDPAHKMIKSLGTSDTLVGGTDGADPDTFYANVVEPIANYVGANGIQAVIGSARVPHLVGAKPDPSTLNLATMSVLGSARFLRDTEGGMVRAISNIAVAPQIVPLELGTEWFQEPYVFTYGAEQTNVANNAFLDFRVRSDVTPYGRIGLPKFEAAVPAETEVETKRMIDDAVAKDGIGVAGGQVHLGYHDRFLPYITGYQTELARLNAVAESVPIKHYIRSYALDWPIQPPPEDYSYADCIAGILNETAFGMVGAAIANQPVGAAYVNSYTWVQGSWGFEATSFGHYLMANMLMNGACAGVGTVAEPQAYGMCETDAFLYNLLAGRTMCEAMFFGKTYFPWMMDCWGDPLYAPYSTTTGCESCLPGNILTDSSFANWGALGLATIDLNAAQAPNCEQNADHIKIGPTDADCILLTDNDVDGTPGALIDFSFWIKRTSAAPVSEGQEEIDLIHPSAQTLGRWRVDLFLLSGGWELITASHPAVNVVFPLKLDGNGDFWTEWCRFGGDFTLEFDAWCLHAVES